VLHFILVLLLPISLLAQIKAYDLMKQVEGINKAHYAKNVIIKKVGKKYSITARRVKKSKPLVLLAERYLNNDYSDGVIASKDLIIIRSGKLKGTGVLIKEFVDSKTSQEYMLWLPALRKVRRIAQPEGDGGLSEVEVAFIEETKLRTVDDETHEILSQEKFNATMGVMLFKDRNRHLKHMPSSTLEIKDRDVYVVRSTPNEKTWYDKRVSYIDSTTYVDYRNEYFFKDKKVKVIDRRWKRAKGIDDIHAYYWYYWYLKNLETGYETATYVPDEIISFNQNVKTSFWSKRTLSKIKR